MGVDITNNTNEQEPSMRTESYKIILNIVVSSLSVPVIVFSALTICVLRKCITIPFQIRYISMCYLFSDGLAHFVLLVQECVLLHPRVELGASWGLISRQASFGLLETVAWVSVTTLAVERALALSMPLRFVGWITKPRVIVCITVIITCDVITYASAVVYGLVDACVYRTSCGVIEATHVSRVLFGILSVVYELTIFVSNLIILRIMRRHQRQIRDIHPGYVCTLDKQFKSSRAIFYIVVTNFILKIPSTIIAAIYNVLQQTQFGGIIELFSFICVLANSLISGILYVWTFKECRLKFIVTFLYWVPRYRARAEEMRLSVYDVVTRSAKNKRSDGSEHPCNRT